MAQNYTRQSSFADGDTITAALFNNEFNQVVNAFAYSASSDSSTGHKHDGTSGQGGNIPQIGDIDFLNKIVVDNTNNRWGFYVQVSSGTVEQLRIQDGAIVPVTDDDIDLGTSSLEFKDLFLDGTAHIDTLDVDVNATVAGTLGVTGATTLSSTLGVTGATTLSSTLGVTGATTLSSTLGVTGATTLSSTLGVTGATTLSSTLGVTGAITGSSTLQATTITATTAFVPDASDGASLGTVSLEFSDLFLADGALIAFGNDQDVTITHLADAGLLLNGARGLFFNDTTQYINAPNGTTLDIAATDEIELNATLIDINGAVDISGNLDVGGNLVVTGTTTFNGGTLTMGDAATDNVVFGADINSNIIPNTDDTYDLGSSSQEWRNLYIDGTANIDSLVADTADINGGTIDGATIATSDITVGSGKTLNVSAGTLTLADNQISGDKVEGGTIAATTITTLTSTTGNITSVNATTVDTTNLEVTTLKAKDGTAAGSIADSTGVVTLASSVLTTTDINGGTVDGVTIGGSSAGDITYANLSDGTITITAFADEDDMSSDSATLVPTQQSVKAYVDSQVGTVDTLSEILANGNTTGSTDIAVDSAQKVQFRDAAIYLNSSVDGQLDIVADTEIQIAATTVDLNGNLDVSGTALVTGVLTTTAATVFNGGFASNADSTLGTDKKVQFRDSAIYINSSADGQLDIVADTEIQIAATTIDINGAINASGEIIAASLDISGDIDVDGTANLDVVDIDGAVDMASTLAVTGASTLTGGVVMASNGILETAGDFHMHAVGDIRFYIDTNNNGADEFEVYGNVAEGTTTGALFTIQDTGNVGIGTGVNIDEILHVEKSSGTTLVKTEVASGSVVGYEITKTGATTANWRIADGQVANGQLEIYDVTNSRSILNADSAEVVINDTSANLDFRVESDGNANMLFVDGGANLVGIGTGSPIALDGNAAPGLTISSNGPFICLQDANNADKVNYISNNTGVMQFGIVGDNGASGKTEVANFSSVGAIFNDGGLAANDFRVESDGNENMLFVDGGANHVNIGTATDYGGTLNVVTTDTSVNLVLASEDAGAASGPLLDFHRNSSSPADNDVTGHIRFRAENDTDEAITYAEIITVSSDVSNASEDSTMYIQGMVAGTVREKISMFPTETVLNDNGVDLDFRVESDTNTHMLFVDAGNNRVGIGTGAPSYEFVVSKDATSGIEFGPQGINSTTSFIQFYNRSTAAYDTARIYAKQFELYLEAAQVIALQMTTTEAVINQSGADIDFRVESDNLTSALFVDGGTGNVTMQGATTTIGSAAASTNVELNINGVASRAQRIQFQEGGTNRWLLGQGAASETSAFELYNSGGVIALSVDRTSNIATFQRGAVFNEGGADSDFRVESDTNTHAIYVDGANNSVTLGSSSSASNTIRTQSTAGFQASTDTEFSTTKSYTFRDGVGIDNPNSSSFSTATAAVLCAGAMSTGRSINATGTVNASGADYAEYEANNGLVISKGSIVGFKADGTLTLTFSEAVRFAVKSTDPAYVGGDTWSDVEPPEKNTTAWDTWFAEAEAKRAKVDRVAYSGKVPVNVQGATAGQYIIAVADSSGGIMGQAVSNPDFSEYKLSVGRVNKVLEDGRAEVAVIIH